jgi:hypothetical protein
MKVMKKPAVTVVDFKLGGKPKEKSEDDYAEEDGDGESMEVDKEGQLSAIRLLRKALDAGDDEKGRKAMLNFLSCTGLGPETEEEEEPDEE